MAGLTDPTLNPLATTTQTTSTAAPDFYNSALSNFANLAQNAITSGGVADPTQLQKIAYSTAPTAITAGQPALTSAISTATGAAGGPDINQFMNPYTAGVVSEIGRLGQRQFNELLAPYATAGAAGSGQFGSRRGMQVYGNVARDVNADILGKQTSALQTGYQNAVEASLKEQQLKNAIAQTLGTLSTDAYNQGVGGLDVLSKLGAQEYNIEQAKKNYPMTAVKSAADVLKGFQIPTTVSQTTTQPAGAGQIGPSPLGQIKDILGALGKMSDVKIEGVTGGQTLGEWLSSKIGSGLSRLLNQGSGTSTDTTGGSPVSSVVNDPNSPLNILNPVSSGGVSVDQSGNVTIPGITDTQSPYTTYDLTTPTSTDTYQP